MASGDQYAQALVELLPNAESAPNALSSTAVWNPYRQFRMHATPVEDDRTDEYRGTAEPITPDRTGWEQSEGSANGRLYGNPVGLFFALALGLPVTTAGNGVITAPDATVIPAGAFRHVWDSSVIDPAVIKTAQFRSNWGNNSGVYMIDRGVTCTAIELGIGDRGEPSTFGADLAGLYQARIANPSLTPTYDATTVLPFYRSHFSVPTWLTGAASPLGMTLNLTSPVEPAPVLAASGWPTAWSRPNEAGAVPRLTGTISMLSVDVEDYDAFYNNSPFAYMVKWVHTQTIAASGYPYKLFIEGMASYTDYDAGEMEHKLRHGLDIPFSTGKSGATQAFKITLVNGQSAYYA